MIAVILELARILGENFPQIGVNLVMFDGEDMGIPGENETYCQGSRYFAKYPPIPLPYEAINLDMVGDKQLHLPIEKYSLEFNLYKVTSFTLFKEKKLKSMLLNTTFFFHGCLC